MTSVTPATRRRLVWAGLTLLLLLVPLAWFGNDAWNWVQGRWDASRAIALGRAELCSVGLPRDPRGGFDPASGLFYSHNLGCVVLPGTGAYIRGWNSRMLAAAADGEVPSLRHKARTADEVRAALAGDAGEWLTAEDRLRDPAGRWEVLVGAGGEIRVRDLRDGTEESTWYDCEQSRAVFADDGTTLLLRIRCGLRGGYASIDLPGAALLQEWEE